jgi:glycerol-1-phosphate dehydrogenase [NAD(P)+]
MEATVGERLPVYIGDRAVVEFIHYCEQRGLVEFLLVADTNTYAALGSRVEEALRARGWDVITVVLKGKEVIADENYLVRVLLGNDHRPRTFLAVGSGTITDITRFVSHRSGREFLSLPTAPSVDGFTSIGAPLVVGGLKQTVICQPPSAVFADLPTLAAAPPRLLAAGFGDLIGKYLSLADWRLSRLVWDDPYDGAIAGRMLGAAQSCAESVDAIAAGSAGGARLLMEGLIEAGFGMLEFGNTSPAGGAEQVRDLGRDEAARRLEAAILPDPAVIEAEVQAVFGSIADELLPNQEEFVHLSADRFGALKRRILDSWDEIGEIAAAVPPSQVIASWLQQVGGPAYPDQLNLRSEEIRQALEYSHYMRKRFTINKLRLLLGIP